VKRLGAGVLAGWSVAGPAFVAYVAGRTGVRVACCRVGCCDEMRLGVAQLFAAKGVPLSGAAETGW
jgi:hypothetical protein